MAVRKQKLSVLDQLSLVAVASAAGAAGDGLKPESVRLRLAPVEGTSQRVIAVSSEGAAVVIERVLGAGGSKAYSLSDDGGTEFLYDLEGLSRPISQVSIGPDGDSLLVRSSRAAHLFRGGERQEIDSPEWSVVAVAFSKAEPLALLAPERLVSSMDLPGTSLAGRPEKPPPLVVRLVDESWERWVDNDEVLRRSKSEHRVHRSAGLRGHELWASGASDGRVAIASMVKADIRIFSKSGVETHRIRRLHDRLEFEEVEFRDPEGELQKGRRVAARVAGVAWGRDGSLLALVYESGGSGKGLIRYLAGTGAVERLAVDVEESSLRITSTRGGLLVWPARLQETYYRFSWESLEEREWLIDESYAFD